MDYSKSTRANGIVTLGLLLLFVMKTVGQTTVPYSEWYKNREVYKLTVFGDPPESRGRLNGPSYDTWVQEQQNNWRDKCTVQPDLGKCNTTETAWYYDNQTQLCTAFSGCETTQNSYKSREECVQVCEQYSEKKPLPTSTEVPTGSEDAIPLTDEPLTTELSEIQPISTKAPTVLEAVIPLTKPPTTELSEIQPISTKVPTVWQDAIPLTKPPTTKMSESQDSNLITKSTTEMSAQVTEPARIVTAGTTKKVLPLKNVVQVTTEKGDPTCGHKLHRLAGTYLQQSAGVPKPISIHDHATIAAEHKVGVTIDRLAMELFTDCSLVNITRTKWLTTEVESTPDGGMFVYQVALQTITFEYP